MATAGKWEEVKPALSPSVLKVLTQVLNFPRMTPVQAHTLPKFLSHKDVAVEVSDLLFFRAASNLREHWTRIRDSA